MGKLRTPDSERSSDLHKTIQFIRGKIRNPAQLGLALEVHAIQGCACHRIQDHAGQGFSEVSDFKLRNRTGEKELGTERAPDSRLPAPSPLHPFTKRNLIPPRCGTLAAGTLMRIYTTSEGSAIIIPYRQRN